MKIIFVLVSALVMALSPAAQEGSQFQCDATMLEETLNEMEGFFSETRTELEADDIAGALRMVRDLNVTLSEIGPMCEGLDFNSMEESLLPVIGPVSIPAGVYRVTAKTVGYFIVHIEVLTGECGGFGSLFNISEGRAISGAQAVFRSEGCEALIEIANATDPWTLTFERVS